MQARRSWLHLPRRTIRLRLTALYGALFLVCGVILLAITNVLIVARPEITAFRIVSGNGGVVKAVAGHAEGAVKLCQAFQLPCPHTKISALPAGAPSLLPARLPLPWSLAASGK